MIGIIGAMKTETEALVSMLENKKTDIVSAREYHTGTLCGQEVVICTCGIGKVFAAICTEAMILRYSPSLIINTGVAGALDDRLDVTDIVVSDNVVQHDMDTSPLGDPVGLISGINKVYFEADESAKEKIIEAVKALGLNSLCGTVASGDAFIASSDAKNKIKANFPTAVCAEMEGGSIGHVAFVNDTPFVVVRAMSDKADGTGNMDYMEFCDIAAQNSVKVICSFLENLK